MSLADATVKRPYTRRADVEQSAPRGDIVRPPIRDAAARAAAIRQETVTADDGTDAFYIPPHLVPEGWSYEWKRSEVIGKPDRQHQLSVARRGWEPVPQERHPELMVENQGMILMERPAEITREAFVMNQVKAKAQVQMKEDQLNDAPEGTGPRDESSKTRARVSRSHSVVEIPD